MVNPVKSVPTRLPRTPLLQSSRAVNRYANKRKKPQRFSIQSQRNKNVVRTTPWRGNPTNQLNVFNNPEEHFRTGQTIRQNRFNEHGLPPIKQFHFRNDGVVGCKDPVSAVEQDQIKMLDPTGRRTALFARGNPRRVKQGDILMVRLKNGEPFSGVCLSIRQRHSKVDWAILLRNHLTRVATEVWYKIYSPNIESIEIVQRATRRARRVRLYYMRKPKHDMGSVDGIVRQYLRKKAGTQADPKAAAKTKGKSKQKKKAKNT